MRLISGATANSNIHNLYIETALISIRERAENAMLIMLFKVIISMCPLYLTDLLPHFNHQDIRYNLRKKSNIRVPFTRLELFKQSFFPYSIKLWNKLNIKQRSSSTLSEFKKE